METGTDLVTESPVAEITIHRTPANVIANAGEFGASSEDAIIGETATPAVRRIRGRPRKDGTPAQPRLPKPAPMPKLRLGKIELVSIDDIHIGENRYRKELGDLQELADSIQEFGLLQPIGVTKERELVFGERRLRACRLVGIEKIPTRTVDIESIARGEHDENELRKDFTPSERVAIQRAIGRKTQGARTDLGHQQNLVDVGGAAEIAGFSNKETSRQAGKVVDNGTPELVKAMDNGDISIDAAAQIAKQPPERQKRMVAMPPNERHRAVRRLRSTSPQAETKRQTIRIPSHPKKAAAMLIEVWNRDMLGQLRDALDKHLREPRAVEISASGLGSPAEISL
jgi:hypothetical protein